MWLQSLCEIKSPGAICCHWPGDKPVPARNYAFQIVTELQRMENLDLHKYNPSSRRRPQTVIVLPIWGWALCTGELGREYPSVTTQFSFIGKSIATQLLPQWVMFPNIKEGQGFPKSAGKIQTSMDTYKELVILVFMILKSTFLSPFTRGFIFTRS